MNMLFNAARIVLFCSVYFSSFHGSYLSDTLIWHTIPKDHTSFYQWKVIKLRYRDIRASSPAREIVSASSNIWEIRLQQIPWVDIDLLHLHCIHSITEFHIIWTEHLHHTSWSSYTTTFHSALLFLFGVAIDTIVKCPVPCYCLELVYCVFWLCNQGRWLL